MEAEVRDAVIHLSEQSEELFVEEKGRLINKLLAGSGLSVVLGNNHQAGAVIDQINMMDKDDLSEILHVIANRIFREGK